MNLDKYIFPSDRSRKLSDFPTDDQNSFTSQKSAEDELKDGIERLSEIQDRLYAQDKFSLLIIISIVIF